MELIMAVFAKVGGMKNNFFKRLNLRALAKKAKV